VEGLARVDVICLDKTGTLTIGEIAFDAAHPLAEVDGWQAALGWYAAAPDANATARAMRATYPAPDALTSDRYIPFSSARKWSAVSLADGRGTWILGAPEMVFGDAANDASTPLGGSVTALAETGRRTLVLAHSSQPLTDADVAAERLPTAVAPAVVLTFREQVRPDAAQTLTYFPRQGVGVRIISGDNPRTVAAIAREVGLDVSEGVDARSLPADPDALAAVLETHTVFGRVTPEQKKGMVVALQSRGHTVAMTGDGVNDALAIKTADIGIAMNSGSAATKAVARLVLLDGRFSHLPDVVAEGRQAIANIERVSMLFLTKTAYATALAVVFGVLVLEFPFLPRQLSITDGLTIGIPAFFLALMPNTQRYVPGFLRRSLSFAIPAGIVIALGLTWYTYVAKSLEVTEDQLRTGATIILAVVGIWVLAVLSRPLNRYKVIVIGLMFVGLVAVFTIPLATEFFALTDPGEDLAVALTGIAIVMIAAIEVIRFVHRRFVAGATIAPSARPVHSVAGRAIATVVAVLAYAIGLLSAGLGVLILLSRYEAGNQDVVLTISLVGAGIALFGLLVVAVAAGIRRGSGLSRLLITVYLALVALLNLLIVVASDEWDWGATALGVLALVVIVVLWTPPAAHGFGRIRDSSMTVADGAPTPNGRLSRTGQ
jgi:cation-transporting P-type ATPase E